MAGFSEAKAAHFVPVICFDSNFCLRVLLIFNRFKPQDTKMQPFLSMKRLQNEETNPEDHPRKIQDIRRKKSVNRLQLVALNVSLGAE